jgi:hypothetical protein
LAHVLNYRINEKICLFFSIGAGGAGNTGIIKPPDPASPHLPFTLS